MADEAAALRVLIAEDEVIIALTLRRQLEAHGIEVVAHAVDGQAAVELCCLMKPNVVLMDLRMPIMDGIEATRRIMAQCPTRVIVLTAMSGPETIAAAHAAGAIAYLTKPISQRQLLSIITDDRRAA